MELYRYTTCHEWQGNVRLYLHTYKVVRETPHYYWIKDCYITYVNGDRRIAKVGKKIFARPTKEAALLDCQCRNTHRIHILKSQLEVANKARLAVTAELGDDGSQYFKKISNPFKQFTDGHY